MKAASPCGMKAAYTERGRDSIPAQIDLRQRRQQVIEAAFRLVVKNGIDGLSLRKVADESGLNIGSVRHYFNGYRELLSAVAQEAGDRMARRLAQYPVTKLRGLHGEAAVDALQLVVEAVLPIDQERLAEAIIIVEFIMASRTKPVFRPTIERMGSDLTAVLSEALEELAVPDATFAATQLAAMVGGLTLDTVTAHGDLNAETLKTVLRSYLRQLLYAADPR